MKINKAQHITRRGVVKKNPYKINPTLKYEKLILKGRDKLTPKEEENYKKFLKHYYWSIKNNRCVRCGLKYDAKMKKQLNDSNAYTCTRCKYNLMFG